MSTIFKLIIEDDEGQATVYPLLDGEVSIGRKEGNTIRLMERNVSRRHARLVQEGEEVFVEDLDSYNGIRVNGERILDRHGVKERDLIEIGDYHLTLEVSEAEPVPSGREPSTEPWPTGTVPDFQLPEDLMGEKAQRAAAPPSPGETLSERPTVPPEPSEDDIPPFPAGAKVGATPTPRAELMAVPGVATMPGELAPKPPERLALPRSGSIRTEPRLREQLEHGAQRSPTYRGPAAVADVARLVCVSTHYAGREYPLDSSPVVIGRVDENDIVIEHRSVSRQHAEISFNGRDHRIRDLQSANGILINGEEYDHTKLKAGDLLELGNVKARFIPAGVPYEATPDEAREMRANGFEPPVVSDPDDRPVGAAGAVAAQVDPSHVATITDSPRSPLVAAHESVTVSEGAEIEALAAERSPSDLEEAPPRLDTVPTDARPTKVDQAVITTAELGNRVVAEAIAGAGGAAARASSVANPHQGLMEPVPGRGAADYVAEPTPAPPKGSVDPRRAMYVIIGTLVVVVALLISLLMSRGDEALDRKLQELYNQGNYQGAIGFFRANEGGFADEKAAYRLAVLAEDRMTDDEPAPAPAAPAPRESAELSLPTSADASRAVRRPAPSPARRRQLEGLAERAGNLIVANDLDEASRLLTRCLDQNPEFALCHRQMGILRANLEDREGALRHYRRYVELAPDAEDAARFRGLIRDAEAQESPP